MFGFKIISTKDFEKMQLKHRQEILNKNICLDANEKRIALLLKENNQLKHEKAKLEAYTQGATEQHKIYIEKAWKWILWMLGTQSATQDFIEESYIRFTKAMEEEQ